MSILQWRDANAPQFGDAIAAYRMGADALDRGLNAAKTGLKDWTDTRRTQASNSLMADLMRFQGDPEALQRAQADGSLMSRYDPKMLTPEAIAAIGARAQDLQNFRLGTSNVAYRDRQVDQLGEANTHDRDVNQAWREDRNFFNTDRSLVRDARSFYSRMREIAAKDGPDAAQAFMALPENARFKDLPQEVVDNYYSGTVATPRGEADLAGVLANNGLTIAQANTERERPALVREQARGAGVDADTGRFNLDTAKEDRQAGDAAFNQMRTLPPNASPGQVQEEFRRITNGISGRAAEIVRERMSQRWPEAFGTLRNPDGTVMGDGYAPTPAQPPNAVPATPVLPNAPVVTPAPASFGFDGQTPAAQLFRASAPAGFQAARPARGPDRVLNYEARAATGMTHVPDNIRTLGQASSFARQLNKAGADSSAMGTYQIVGTTLRNYAPKVFGKNWENRPFNEQTQDAIGRQIFNDHRGSAQALRSQWVSLSLAEAERVRRMPWEQAKAYIAAGESGNGNPGIPAGPASVPMMLASASQGFGMDTSMSAPVQRLGQPVDSSSPGSPFAGKLYGGSDSMEGAPTGAARPSAAEQLLREMADRGPAPMRIAGNDDDTRRMTNVAALFRNRAIAARARFS
jgi:hypothetical protein